VNIPSSITTLLIGIVLAVVSFWYGQNHGLLPIEASDEAALVDGLFNLMMTIGTGLFLIVQGALIYSLFKFRRRSGDDSDGPYVEGNIPLEILWTSIPAVIVLGIAVYSFEVYTSMGGLNPMDHSVAHGNAHHQMAQMPGAAIAAPLTDTTPSTPVNEAAPAAATPAAVSTQESSEITIQAAGLQYAWIFTYPDSGVVAGELHVPVGKRIRLQITANDVLHAFWVPEYRLKQDAIPGEPTELSFTPNRVGEYPVICAELCGPYHGAMKTKVIAHTPEEYDAWVASQQVASASGLEQAVAISPAAQSVDQFLTPFTRQMGIDSSVVEHLHPPHIHPSAR
jgi:cytochrome c oxidase subunit 2